MVYPYNDRFFSVIIKLRQISMHCHGKRYMRQISEEVHTVLLYDSIYINTYFTYAFKSLEKYISVNNLVKEVSR